jgi:transcriptional regulator with XRE-family HTH domain
VNSRKTTLDPKTRELRRLMKEHKLSTRAVAALVSKSRQTVKRYTSEFTIISQATLDLLKYRLTDPKKTTEPAK